ncbi:MAG: hypothetical protein LBK29_00815 [Oscillospiraceae bacterium]|jgi:hypothetical protein|nr:hypothetical protein [Oscillospiraceae bacterium]
MNDGKGIFRKSSIERVSSPERLNEYVKVTNPSLLAILLAVFVILAAGMFWISSSNIPKYVKFEGISISEKSYETGENVNKVYSYVDIGTAQKLNAGMKVATSLEYAPSGEFGYINGTVTKIGENIITENDLNKFSNPSIFIPVLKEKNLVEVEIILGEWSSEKGKDMKVIDGSICSNSVTVGNQRAYELIFNA